MTFLNFEVIFEHFPPSVQIEQLYRWILQDSGFKMI